MASRILILLAACGCAAALSGCKSTSLADAAGHYEGFIVSGSGASPEQISISGDVAQVSDSELKLAIRTEPATSEIDFDLQMSSNGQLQLSSAQELNAPITLAADPGQAHCYAGSSATSELCFDGNELSIVLPSSAGSLRIVLYQLNPAASPSPAPSMETPQPYTVEQLIGRSENQSFTTEVQFQSVVQANLTAQNAYLNLLPHINFGSGLDLVGLVTDTMVRAIGDLLPFFLPDRWFQANSLGDDADAEFDSYRVVQAGAMNIVQGLGLSVLRDEQALLTMEENRAQITEVRDEVLAAEQNGSGTVQVGTSDDITAILQALMSSIDSMREHILEEKRSLSQATGFYNPAAVSEVDPVTLPAISGPIPGAQSGFETSATNRSLDLLQLDDLIQAALETKKSAYFQWLDPTGADQGSLGFGTVDYIEVDSSAIQQLYDEKTEVQSQLLSQVDNALSQSGQISDQYQLAAQSSQTNQNNINRLLMDFRTGVQFDMSDLVTALSNKAQSDVNQVNAQYAYLILQAQMDFLTYSGDYAVLLTEKNQ